jgi:antitoxin HicB
MRRKSVDAASAAAKVLLLNEMVEQTVTAADLARRLNTSPRVVNRVIDIHHARKIDTIAKALEALGKRLEIGVV